MLFLLSYIILGTFHPLLVIVETRTFTFHLVSSTTPFSIAVPSTEVHKVVHPISTTGKWDKIPALQNARCCQDFGMRASFHPVWNLRSDVAGIPGLKPVCIFGRMLSRIGASFQVFTGSHCEGGRGSAGNNFARLQHECKLCTVHCALQTIQQCATSNVWLVCMQCNCQISNWIHSNIKEFAHLVSCD